MSRLGSWSAMNSESCSKIVADPVADELDDRLELELLGEGLADLVDERQLRVPLAGLLDRPDPRQRRADVLADEGEQVAVGLV